MAQIKVDEVRKGQHPSEVVVAVKTADGSSERVIVDRRSIRDGMLEIGYPVGYDRDRLLIELPRESVRGVWRVWVPRDAVTQKAAA
jgi:hypothetical protein